MEQKVAMRVFLGVVIITLAFFVLILPFVLMPDLEIFGAVTSSSVSSVLMIGWVVVLLAYVGTSAMFRKEHQESPEEENREQ